LDVKLGVFTIRGTVEPRLVQLFPRLSCSCPTAGGCYQIAAAKQAIGLNDGVQRKVLNLTQLRRNKRKRPDKTAGRKRPSTVDIDVVAAPDADPMLASAAVGDIGNAQAPTRALDGNDDVEPPEAADLRQDVCHACDSAEPPARKNRRQREINCPRWYHVTCVGVRNTNAAYMCDFSE